MENQDNQLNWSWNNNQSNQTENLQPEWNWNNNQENDIPQTPEPQEPEVQWGNNIPEPQEPEVQWGNNASKPVNVDPPLNQSQQQLNEFYYLGKVNSNIHNKSLWNIPVNLELIQDELNKIELTPKNTEGLFDFSPSSDTELGKLIKNIFSIGLTSNLKIKDCFVVKPNSNGNIDNIFENQESKYNFIFPIVNDSRSLLELPIPNSNELALASHLSPSILTILPGWTSYNLTNPQNTNNTILICGTYEQA